MSSATNIALNSRTMSGIILISDGVATLSEGDLTCDDITSNSLGTGNITTNNLTCNGELRTNTNGPYSIPVSATSTTGSLISYGNVSNSGATDFTNYGSTYNLLKQGFYFNNINSTTALTNLAIIDNTQTYFKSPLTGCTAESPLNTTSVVNKTYVDSNFLDRTNNLTQNVNGEKTFTNNLISNSQTTFNNLTPICSVANPTAVNHLTRKDYVDSNFVDRTNNLTQNINGLKTFTNDTVFSAQATFNNFTPFSNVANPTAVNHLTRKDYVDSNFVDRTNNLTQNINGLKTFTNNTNFTASLLARSKLTLYEWDNQTGNTLTLTFPMKQIIALRVSSGITMTVQLPALTTNEIGMVFSFVKLSSNINITLTTGGLNNIYTLNNLGTNTTTNTTLLSADKITTTLAVGFFGATIYWIEVSPYSTFDRDQNNLIYARLASPNAFTNTNTFNSFLPTSTLTPSLNTELITKIFADQTYINFTSDQTITGIKRFGTIFTGDHSWRDVGSPFSNRVQSYVSGTSLELVPQFNNNTYTFYTKDGAGTQSSPLIINSTNTTIANNFISNGQANFNNNVFSNATTNVKNINWVDVQSPFTNKIECYLNADALIINPLFNLNRYAIVTKDFVGNQINAILISNASTTIANNLISNGEANFNNLVHLKSTTRIYDLITPFTNYTSLTTSGNAFAIYPNYPGSSIQFYCRTAGNLEVQTFYSFATANTSVVPFIASSTATFNGEASFNGITRVKEFRLKDLLGGANEQQTYLSGTIFDFVALFNSNTYRFFCRDSGSTQTSPLIINSTDTTVANNLISNSQTTFNNFTPISNVASPTANNHLTRKDYIDNNFMNLTTGQTKSGTVNFLNQITFNGGSGGGTAINCNNGLNANTFLNVAGTASLNATTFVKDFRWVDVNSPFTNIIQSYISGNNLGFIPLFNSNTYTFYCKDAVPTQTSPLVISSASTTIANNLISNSQATFNNIAPISNTAPSLTTHLTTKAYVDSVSGSSILSLNNNFTGFNTFQVYQTFKASLDLQDGTGTKTGSVGMLSSGVLSISTNVPSGSINFGSDDALGGNFSRATINENEFNFEVPITLNVDYTYYNPFNFNSTRLGYSTSNTGSTNTLTNNIANNSGQIFINAGSWNISYTGTITVITNAITTLTSLEIYVADSLTNDLNIIGINIINYYKISTVPVGQKMRISGSGNYISYVNTSTELNLRLLPLFTAGTGGLNFQGKISATRNA